MSWWVIAFWDGAPSGGSVITSQRIYAPRGNALPYPQTVGGITLGDDGTGLTTLSATGWASGNDAALRGQWRVTNSGAARDLRIDLPFAGRTVDVILGLSGQNFQRSRIRLWDGDTATGTNFLDFSTQNPGDAPPGGTFTQFQDFATAGTGSVEATVWRAMDADALDPLPFVRQRAFTNSFLTIQLGAHASGLFQSELSFIALRDATVGGSGGTPGLLYMQSQARMAGIHPY